MKLNERAEGRKGRATSPSSRKSIFYPMLPEPEARAPLRSLKCLLHRNQTPDPSENVMSQAMTAPQNLRSCILRLAPDKKRAETRECPVCNEQIPVRLLEAHAELEADRVEAIIRRVGDTDVDFEALDSLESLVETWVS